ncbi:hypothetical protein ASU36_10230 [Staphylococcus aureus]|nr:hypothetical protein ASU36_10230 [Staphylococcus aureus]
MQVGGPQHREFQKEILQTMQVGGAPTQKLTESQLTIMCKLAGPQHRSWRKAAYNNVQVGERVPKKDDSKFIVVTTSSIMTPLLLL